MMKILKFTLLPVSAILLLSCSSAQGPASSAPSRSPETQTPASKPAAAASTPSTSEPRIAFDTESVDLGKVPLDREVPAAFHFRNLGNAPLTVEGLSIKELEGC